MNGDAAFPITASERVIASSRELRGSILTLEHQARDLMEHPVFHEEQSRVGQHGEMKANIMLAVRHLEDARMRLGKVIQHAEDGVSIYDRH